MNKHGLSGGLQWDAAVKRLLVVYIMSVTAVTALVEFYFIHAA